MFKKRVHHPPVERQRVPVSRPGDSAKVFSYYTSRSPHVPEHGRTRRPVDGEVDMRNQALLRERLSNLPLVISLIAIVVCAGYNTVLTTQPRIIITGEDAGKKLLRDTKWYEAQAEEVLAASVLNRSKFTFQAKSVQNELSKRFPELGDVSVSLPFMGVKPVVYLDAAAPALALVARDGGSYVLDDSGRVISTDITAVPATIPVVNDRSGTPAKLGARVLTSKDVSFVKRFLHQLRAQSISIDSLLLPAGTQELQAKIAGKPYYARASLREDPLQQAGALVAASEYLESQKITPGAYIDLRVGERVFYR